MTYPSYENPPVRNWKGEDRSREYASHPKWNRRGKFGKNCLVDNCHVIEFGEHYNGSGEQAMNGSTKWPVLNIQISFLEDDERKRFIVAKRIAELLNELLQTPKE